MAKVPLKTEPAAITVKKIENRARSWRYKHKPLRSGIFGRRKCIAFTQIPLRPGAHKAHALGEIPVLADL
jgi:hypothetical protein